MDVIKRVISLEEATSRAQGEQYGTLTATSFYFKVQFNQTIDNMGIFTDFPFIPGEPLGRVLTMEEKLLRLGGAVAADWFHHGNQISGYTDSKVEVVRGYDVMQPFVVGFDIESETYQNYSGGTVNGVSRVTSLSGSTVGYSFDANNDLTIGTTGQTTGLRYSEDMESSDDSPTTVNYNSEGWNETNSSLSAIIKQEYLMGIINPPEVKSDVFIDRGNVTVMESHLRMSEVESLDHLVRYGNGFYNIVRQ